MFNFLKKKVKENTTSNKISTWKDISLNQKPIDEDKREKYLKKDGQYKILSWWIEHKNANKTADRTIPLEYWNDIEEGLNIIEKEFNDIEEGRFIVTIEDSITDEWNREIASLQIQIKHGYMRPYFKYRAEDEQYADEWKEYWAKCPCEEGDSLAFDHDNLISLCHLTKDIDLVKKLFKMFYETGDVSEEYMY